MDNPAFYCLLLIRQTVDEAPAATLVSMPDDIPGIVYLGMLILIIIVGELYRIGAVIEKNLVISGEMEVG
jgi:hypothetical protein